MDKGTEFSYRKFFCGDSLMVIIPHEDDEINIAGATIYGARQEGMHVVCVFITNGDFSYLPSIRFHEAVNALNVLGVPSQDVIFLGYPDGGVWAEHSVFMHGQKSAVVVDARNETCGSATIPEFCLIETGRHHQNTWGNLLGDLKAVIEKYKPSGIIATDLDSHPDHRMCSLAFEKVMGEILNAEGNTYHPVVLKAFAYNTGFESAKDFYAENLLSTIFNRAKIKNVEFETDNPIYEWEKRIRFPVPAQCRESLLWKNIIFRSLRCHISQRAFLRADRIINGDQVFWARRTDNLLYRGRVNVSSGESKYLHDFQIINMKDICPAAGILFEDCVWVPDENDHEKSCQCTFAQPQHIESISLYGNPDNTGRILRGKITFSNGYACDVPALREWGRETIINIPAQEHVEWIRFQILKVEGSAAGLSEWEVFAKKKPSYRNLHILVNKNFAYEWQACKRNNNCVIGAYVLEVDAEIHWFWDGKEYALSEIQNLAKSINSPHRICAVADDCRSEIQILPQGKWNRGIRFINMVIDRLHTEIEKQKIKPEHHRLRKITKKARKL